MGPIAHGFGSVSILSAARTLQITPCTSGFLSEFVWKSCLHHGYSSGLNRSSPPTHHFYLFRFRPLSSRRMFPPSRRYHPAISTHISSFLCSSFLISKCGPMDERAPLYLNGNTFINRAFQLRFSRHVARTRTRISLFSRLPAHTPSTRLLRISHTPE